MLDTLICVEPLGKLGKESLFASRVNLKGCEISET